MIAPNTASSILPSGNHPPAPFPPPPLPALILSSPPRNPLLVVVRKRRAASGRTWEEGGGRVEDKWGEGEARIWSKGIELRAPHPLDCHGPASNVTLVRCARSHPLPPRPPPPPLPPSIAAVILSPPGAIEFAELGWPTFEQPVGAVVGAEGTTTPTSSSRACSSSFTFSNFFAFPSSSAICGFPIQTSLVLVMLDPASEH